MVRYGSLPRAWRSRICDVNAGEDEAPPAGAFWPGGRPASAFSPADTADPPGVPGMAAVLGCFGLLRGCDERSGLAEGPPSRVRRVVAVTSVRVAACGKGMVVRRDVYRGRAWA